MSTQQMATTRQLKHAVTLIDQQVFMVDEMEAFLLYLPHLGEGIKGRAIPSLDDFRAMFGLEPFELITEIDFGKTLPEMIAAAGNDWVNPNITPENFPVVGGGVKRFRNKMFAFKGNISSKAGVALIEKGGFVPATHVHGFAFSAKFPGEQRKYPYTCLGSSAEVGGSRRVVCFSRGDAERDAFLLDWADVWPDRWRLLGVQEISGA